MLWSNVSGIANVNIFDVIFWAKVVVLLDVLTKLVVCHPFIVFLGCVCTYFCVVNFLDSILRVFRGGNGTLRQWFRMALWRKGRILFWRSSGRPCSGAVGAVVAEAQLDYNGWRRRYEWFLLRSFCADSGGVTDYKILGLPPMFSAIQFISEAISMLDRRVAKQARRGGKKVLADHPLSVFDSVPHPFYTWFDLLQAWVADACLGNGYILIERDRAQRPEQLILVPSGMCTPVYINGTLYYEVSGEILGRLLQEGCLILI